MRIRFIDIIAITSAVIWPIMVLILAIAFRKALEDLSKGIVQRVKGVSIPGWLSIEFSVLTEGEVEWSTDIISDVRHLSESPSFMSGAEELVDQLRGHTHSDYAVFDLGEGRWWLDSRLYLFGILLHELRELRYLVFVENTPQGTREFIGVAEARVMRHAFATRFPWMEEAFTNAYSAVNSRFDGASELIRLYLADIQDSLKFVPRDIENIFALRSRLVDTSDQLSVFLRSKFTPGLPTLIDGYKGTSFESSQLRSGLADQLNGVIEGQPIYRSVSISAPERVMELTRANLSGDALIRLNRMLLESAYDGALRKSKIQINLSPSGAVLGMEESEKDFYVRLGDTNTWERARWLDGRRIEHTLGKGLMRSRVKYSDFRTGSRQERSRMISLAEGSVIAEVSDRDRFETLIDRQTYIEELARSMSRE